MTKAEVLLHAFFSAVQLLFDGFLSALISAGLAAGVAVWVVRHQVGRDDQRAQRAEDVRVAVELQAAALRFAFAVGDFGPADPEHRDRNKLELRTQELWTMTSAAYFQRADVAYRNWGSNFQKVLVQRTNEFTQGPTADGMNRLMAWANYCSQAIASHLEEGAPLPSSPAELWRGEPSP